MVTEGAVAGLLATQPHSLQGLMKISSLHFVLIVVIVLPFTSAWRDGARVQSCYDHAIEHTITGNPPVAKLTCTPPCQYNLTLEGKVNEVTREVISDTVSEFVCGSVYKFTIAPATDIGFLIQARSVATSDTFDAASVIVGTWITDENENYQILNCSESQDSTSPTTFPNTVTQADSTDAPETNVYWKAPVSIPSELESIPIRFFYTVVATFGTFYEPLFTPAMDIICPTPTTTEAPTTEAPTTEAPTTSAPTTSAPTTSAEELRVTSFSTKVTQDVRVIVSGICATLLVLVNFA